MQEIINVETRVANDKCSGCMMCSSICPVNAISFKIKNGFRYPTIYRDKCINCGACVRKCPAINSQVQMNNPDDIKLYAAWSKNTTQRKLSTSGAICYELSKYILQNGGCVAGVAWTSNLRDAEYVLIEKLEDLSKITQTKYFQPQMNGIYGKIKNKLEQGIVVLYIGTACTNASLKAFLNKEYSNLYCCDFICRGYTSQEYHARRVEYLENKYKSSINSIQYKNKDQGWTHFGTKFHFNNGKTLYLNRNEDPYELMFQINDYNTRPSCYDCKYRSMPRLTDITVGDFWTIQGVSDDDLDNGISAVFTFNDKGQKLIDNIKNQIVLEERKIDEVSKGNYALLHQIKKPSASSDQFFTDMKNMDFGKFESKYGSRNIIRMRNIKKIAARLTACNLISFVKLNFLSKGVIRKKHKYIFPYYGSRIEIQKGGKLLVNDNLMVNYPKHKHSNEQAYIKIMNGGVFEVNGRTNVAADATVEVLPKAELKIGSVETNYGTTIICSNKILMGNGVAIGRGAMIYDSNYHPTSINKNIKLKPLVIKDHVWICSGVTITKGITIEEGAVCGINSTVSRNVKSKHLVMGNPAKSFLSNIEW